jgi:hypothetical protein
LISTERQRWGRIAAGVLLIAVVAVVRGQVLLGVSALVVAVPVSRRLLMFVRIRRSRAWRWPTVSSAWPTGLLGIRGWLVATLGACAAGLLAAALQVPSFLVTILGCGAGAILLVATPVRPPRRPVAR